VEGLIAGLKALFQHSPWETREKHD
jgi:hypothetical protein